MKKLIILWCLLLGSITSYSQNKVIQVEADLSGRQCRYNSAQPCGITIVPKKKTNATLQLSEKGNLIMQLNKSKLPSITIKNLLKDNVKKDMYILKDTFVLENELREALDLPIGIGEIPKGNYPLQVSEKTITITFKLR